MIRMRVRVENEIEAGDGIAQQLQAQIGSGIDQKEFSVRLDLHRLPQPAVPRIVRCAHAAAATDDGNAGGSASAEKGDDHDECGMQNAEFRMKKIKPVPFSILHSAFCVLHSNDDPVKFPSQWVDDHGLSRFVPRGDDGDGYASICSSGSRLLCLKFDRESRFSTLSTKLRAVRFGINFNENFDTGFFEA